MLTFRGKDFRVDYANLSVVCSTFANIPILAMASTATRQDREDIKRLLGFKQCVDVVGNPDRKNVFNEKHFRVGSDMDSLISILTPMAKSLLHDQINYPLKIVYIPLKWCGFAYRIFDSILGSKQYFPAGSMAIPENRLFAQFHSPQTKEMKDKVLKQLCSTHNGIRVVFATVALGMGVDIRHTKCSTYYPTLYHTVLLPRNWQSWKGWSTCNSHTLFNNRDIAKNKPGMKDAVQNFCQSEGQCLRKYLLAQLDTDKKILNHFSPKHICCSVCKSECKCSSCNNVIFPI